MNPLFNTIMKCIGITALFVTFLSVFGTLAAIVALFGIMFASNLFFTVGWWAALLVMLGVLLIYVIALAVALEFIERKTI